MAKKEFKARLTTINDLTPTVRELVLTMVEPTSFEFKAGQFVMINMPGPEKMVQRAYSIASADSVRGEFKLVIKYYEIGVASKWVQTLKGGEEITFTGPFGKYLFKEPAAEQVIFVCTSTGLAPFYSMLTSKVCQGLSQVAFKIYMGVWNEKEIFYKNELDALKKNLPKLEVNFVLDKADPNWVGLQGYVTDHVAKLDLTKPTEVYLCGNPAMLKAVKEMLLAKGFPQTKIYSESYG
jgi:NAD(P)H-flavin reductase